MYTIRSAVIGIIQNSAIISASEFCDQFDICILSLHGHHTVTITLLQTSLMLSIAYVSIDFHTWSFMVHTTEVNVPC